MAKTAEEQGQILREFRVTAWLTTARQGQLLGLTANAITQWETGRTGPSRDQLERLAEIWDAPFALIQHELGYDVPLPLVDGQPFTLGRWHDAIRAKRRGSPAVDVKHNVNRFAPANGVLPVLALSSRDGLLERVG